ncbi:carbohydrate-binding protein [Aminobacter sp. AP02]|uniref:carbohydrate-binding protein n=1 Tax=Aminobacter sp. AP02 TaxID=2135737 RepID=UPI000D6D5F33|nr:carbohydrate-binding protein [Aminobacter sp. AP02]PWK65884.1 hypothetical protein C8K44_11599 [Aminobacter sp. AP02]
MTSSVYSTGTVSVSNGSPIVTGTDTAWDVALVTGGMFSFAGYAVPIASVEGDTSLTLAYGWPGATASGGYAIARETSEAVRAAWINDRLAQILTKLSLAGIHPDGAGTLAERNALSPQPAAGYLWLRVEIGYGLDIYKRTPSGWDGPFGITGPEGPAGTLRWIEAGWASGTAYEYNDGLTRNGTSYRCFVAHTSGAATEPGVGANWQTVWKVTAAKGDSFRFRGAYSGATAYLANDVVRDGGSSWVALQATTGNAPPALPATTNAYWELMAVKGQDGTGTGDVVGPAGVASNRMALFDGLSGKQIKAGTLTEVLDMVGSPAEGDILYRGASGWTRLPKGAAGQVLRQNTALTAPEWGAPAPRGHLTGIQLANNAADATNDIDWTAGDCASSSISPILMVVSAGTMQLDVAFGTGNGGRFDAAMSDGSWHCFVISNGVTVKVGMSKSTDPTSQPNYPVGYAHHRRVGSIIRDGGVIRPFMQAGDMYLWATERIDRNSNANQASVLLTVSVPTGIVVQPLLRVQMSALGVVGVVNQATVLGSAMTGLANLVVAQIYTSAASETAVVTATPPPNLSTNTSGQLWFAHTPFGGAAPSASTLYCYGYIDSRGRV